MAKYWLQELKSPMQVFRQAMTKISPSSTEPTGPYEKRYRAGQHLRAVFRAGERAAADRPHMRQQRIHQKQHAAR